MFGKSSTGGLFASKNTTKEEEEVEELLEEWEEATAEHDKEWFDEYEKTHNTTTSSLITKETMEDEFGKYALDNQGWGTLLLVEYHTTYIPSLR